MMQQVTELVKNGFYFAMRQHGGLIAQRRGEVAADQTQVREEGAGVQSARDETIHPCAAALVFAGMPVGVETSQECVVLIANVVIMHLRIPGRHASFFHYPNAVE